jgi:Trpc4-associated protein
MLANSSVYQINNFKSETLWNIEGSESFKQTCNSKYDTTLLEYLFDLMLRKELRLHACQLIETILLHIPMLNLNTLANMQYVLNIIDDDGLSCMCKIFSITLSDLDTNEKKYWSNIQKKQQMIQKQLQQQSANTSKTDNSKKYIQMNEESERAKSSLSIRDQNQDLLLNTPNLLKRLVKLVLDKHYTKRTLGEHSELEHWIKYIDETLSDTDDSEQDLDLSSDRANLISSTDSNLGQVGDRPNTSAAQLPIMSNSILNQPALITASKLNNFVHVLYTLSLLLVGKERKKVQKLLTECGLATALNDLFDYLIWNCRCEYMNSSNEYQQQPQQQRSHICPEVAVKIQFLRLIHSFCDHSEYESHLNHLVSNKNYKFSFS